MSEPVLYGVDAFTSDDFRAHVLTDEPGVGVGTRLSVCGQSHRKWRPVRLPAPGLRGALGAETRRLLSDDGFTQKDLATTLGVSEKHLSQALQGKSGTTEFFDRIAAALGCRWEVQLVPIPPSPSTSREANE